MTVDQLLLVAGAFFLGGVLKGATGAGAPFLAVPVMAIVVDVPFAVAVFLVPNIVSNSWQAWRFRMHLPDRGFVFGFAGAGLAGAALGTVALAGFSSRALTTAVALVVLVYVLFRLARPGWVLAPASARLLVVPAGLVGGFFQGATGLSGPVSVTFMSAVGLPRPQFIVTMSLFFLAMALSQLPAQLALGVMTAERLGFSALAVVPLLLGVPVGDALGRRVSHGAFDRIIMAVLTLLAIRLLLHGLFP